MAAEVPPTSVHQPCSLEATPPHSGRSDETKEVSDSPRHLASFNGHVPEVLQPKLEGSFWQAQRNGRPKFIVFIRHGESEANIDREITSEVPDHRLHLTQCGRAQATEAGQRLRSIIGDDPARFFVSPYTRTKETLNGILRAWPPDKQPHWREDVRLREQEYGNFDRADIKSLHREKEDFGKFYYRFPEGESPADCYDRASSFVETLYRSWEDNTCKAYAIIGHGLMILVTLIRLLRMPVSEFDELDGLRNCEFIVLERPDNHPKYDIAYTWAPGEEKLLSGLRRKPPPSECPIWDGDPAAPPLASRKRARKEAGH